MRASSLLLAAALLMVGPQNPLFAQAKPKPAAKAPVPVSPAAPSAAGPTKEQIEDAAFEMRVFVSAMSSDKVEAPVKDALMGCLYQNNFAKISDAIGKIIAQNPDKIAKRNADQVLVVLAGVCGYRPKEAPVAVQPGAPAPTPAAPAKPVSQQGR